MSHVTLYGPPQSSYVRTARLVCLEKHVDHDLKPVELGSPAHLALHPWGKVPVLEHGALRVFETSAIARYVDAAFDGPALQPASAADRAVQDQWISVVDCYLYDDAIRNYALQYIFPRGAGGAPDRAVIDARVPKIERAFQLLDAAYADREWIAGDALSLADLFIAPVVQTAARFPEAAAVLEGCRHLRRAYAAVESRPSHAAVTPKN